MTRKIPKDRRARRAFDRKVGTAIRDARAKLELSPAEVAHIVGRSLPQYYRYESGETTCDPMLLSKLSEMFGLSVGHFFGERS